MLEAIDRLVLTRIAQPTVDALQIDPVSWSRKAAQTSSSAFVISCLGVAAIFGMSLMPFNSVAAMLLGATHVLSVRIDAYAGRLRRDDPMASFGRVFQLFETAMAITFLCYVLASGSAVWIALTCVFLAGLVLSDAVAYVSICDRPPPPRRNDALVPSGAVR